MISTWVALLLAGAGALELDPGLPCGLASELRVTLPPGWSLRATRDGEAIDLRLNDGAVLVASRRLQPKPEDCPALPRIVATLVRSWLDNPFPAPKKKAPAAEVEKPPVAEVDPVETAEVAEPAAPVEALPVPNIVAPQRPVPRTPTFAVMVAGGASGATNDAITGTVMLMGEWTISGRWGLAIEGGQQTDRAKQSGAVVISAQLHWLGVGARAELFAVGAHRLLLSIGLQLIHLGAGGARAGEAVGGVDLFLPAFDAHLESRHALNRSLFLLARLGVQGRLRPEMLLLDEVALTVPPWGFGLQVGLGWNFP